MNALTKSFKSASGVLLLSGVAAASLLSSCANENALTGIEAGGIPVKVNVSVPGSDLTRTNLTELNGDLKWEWSDGDRLVATTTDGSYAGTLTLKEITNAEKTSATFEGNISSSLPNGEVKLNFHYVGDADPLSVSKTFSVNYATQNGEFEALKNRDIISTTVVANKTANYCAIPNFQMSHYLSAGHFELIFDDASTEVSSVTISGTGLKNSSVLNLGNCNWTDTDGSISVDPAKKDFYVTLAPAGNLDMVFTAVTTTGKTFEGKMGVVFDLPSGRYLRRKISDSEYVGIPIDMTEKQGGGDNPGPDYPGYENEDPRNPLHKWAKYNLERKDGVINGFVDSETENGALYQWGRNYGYMDKSGTYPGSNVRISGDFTNYFDAMGDYEWFDAFGQPATASTGYYRVFDYYVYNPNSAAVTSGTGLKGFSRRIGNKTEWWANLDNFNNYTTIEDLKAHQDKFFIDFGNQSLDYWIPSEFGNGGNTWEVRAEKCGYDRTNPCPDGWRIPTEADFKEICPSSLPSYQGNLSTLITQKAQPELREANNGTKYVIRWLNYTGYLKIEAIVVDNNFQESDIKAIVWDNNPMVVTRLFPFTGNISSFTALDTRLSYYLGQEITLVIPYVFGAITQTKKEEGNIYYGVYYYPWTLFTPAENFGSAIGGYWANEKILFQFEDTSRSGGNLKSSCITIRSGNPELGYAIRPVMDK